MSDNLQSIDSKHLDNIANGDEDFKKELMEIFMNQIPAFIKNMTDFFATNNMEKLAREAHTAKSSVLIFGMENTGKLLKDIQFFAENNQVSDINPALKKVVSEMSQAKVELAQLLKES
jgi:HPt (histidine-containing phosphotransfer) domain-containing protein